MTKAHEIEATDLILNFLRNQGQNPQNVRYPDEENRGTSDVDLEYRLGDQIWNLEHTRFTFGNRVPSNSTAVMEQARPALEKIAAESQLALYVAFCADFQTGSKNTVQDVVDALIDTANQVVSNREAIFLEDGMTSVQISKSLPQGEVDFAWFLSNSTDIGEQARNFLLGHVRKKLVKQLGPYRNLGHKTGLIIDLRLDPTREQSSFYPISDQTIPGALTELGNELPFRPDVVFLISHEGEVSDFRYPT